MRSLYSPDVGGCVSIHLDGEFINESPSSGLICDSMFQWRIWVVKFCKKILKLRQALIWLQLPEL